MFQNLRVNSQLYILHKGMNPYVEYGSVMGVSAPKPKYPAVAPVGQFPQLEMVVDVEVSVGGQAVKLQGLPAGAEITDSGQDGEIVVSCSRDAMNNEVAMLKQKSEEVLKSIEYHKGVIESCEKMIQTLNPEIAAKKQQQDEIDMLKSQMSEMGKNMQSLMAMNKQLMEQLGCAETPKKQKT